MAVREPRYSRAEFARRGQEIHGRQNRPHVEACHGPNAHIGLLRVGPRAADRVGSRSVIIEALSWAQIHGRP